MSRGGPISEERWRERGYGEGRGLSYKPWLTVRSFGSRGMAHRVRGVKTRRVHHLHSTHELNCFLVLEWHEGVEDVREQYPLHPLSATQEIAADLGCRHPAQRQKRKGRYFDEERTMTTDFLVDFALPAPSPQVAISVKPSSSLESGRVLEKLEIERRYWRRRNVPWRLITERDLPVTFAKNVRLLRHYYRLEEHGLSDLDTHALLPALHGRLSRSNEQLAGRACEAFDMEEGLPKGTAIALLWHALAVKRWRTNMSRELGPTRPLPALRKNGRGEASPVARRTPSRLPSREEVYS